MIVVKLGGSLLKSGWLLPCLDKLIDEKYAAQGVVVVPGGGVFADQVRDLQQEFHFNDSIAHNMAILAMQQMALFIKGLKTDFALTGSTCRISSIINKTNIVIWSPALAELDSAGIKSTWDITSDSLSAWLAAKLMADELILIKSVTIDKNSDVSKLVRAKIVDESFTEFTLQAAFKLTILHAKDFVS